MVDASRDQVLRYVGVDSDPVNWSWLCDKGRFGFESVGAGDRLTAAAVESDLLADARESTTATMGGLAERLGYARVSVQFDEIPANSSPTRKANP